MFPFPMPAELKHITPEHGSESILLSKPLYAVLAGDNMERADELRKLKFIGFAMCITKNKRIDLFLDTDGKIYGVSVIKLDRYFDIRDKVI